MDDDDYDDGNQFVDDSMEVGDTSSEETSDCELAENDLTMTSIDEADKRRFIRIFAATESAATESAATESAATESAAMSKNLINSIHIGKMKVFLPDSSQITLNYILFN